jgi:hypothetical protein
MSKEKTIHELMKEHPDKSYREMEKYRDEDRQQEAGQCIMGEMRKDREDSDWKDKYNKEHKLRQEAEGELTIVKGISVHMSPEMRDAQKKITELQNSLDRFKKENNDCYNRIAEALEVNESHQKLNGKLQERLTELEEENKKMHEHINKKLDAARKSGM